MQDPWFKFFTAFCSPLQAPPPPQPRANPSSTLARASLLLSIPSRIVQISPGMCVHHTCTVCSHPTSIWLGGMPKQMSLPGWSRFTATRLVWPQFMQQKLCLIKTFSDLLLNSRSDYKWWTTIFNFCTIILIIVIFRAMIRNFQS